MLQQTRAATVVPYFRRFVRRFPTVRALAAAPLADVLRLWEGLGYYARARNLHAASRQVVGRLGGRLPTSAAALRALPGIGDYTAAAIASLCFGEAVPAVDGNAKRVAARFLGLTGSMAAPAARRRIAGFLADAIPPDAPGPFNEAVMELGATVCAPAAPRCGVCPLSGGCRALAIGRVHRIPAPRRRRPVPHFDEVACVIRRGGDVVIVRRPCRGLLGGLWDFPGSRVAAGEAFPATARRAARALTGLSVRVGDRLGTIPHAYSHFRITRHAFAARADRGTLRSPDGQEARWAPVHRLHEFALPVTARRIARLLQASWSDGTIEDDAPAHGQAQLVAQNPAQRLGGLPAHGRHRRAHHPAVP
jgi:A/G-specific adenine glycosylase